MPSLKEVKVRITSVMSTQQITKAMKMVAAAKLRRSQERITVMRPYSKKMTALMNNLTAGGELSGWYRVAKEEKKILVIVISADRGLCGSFNSSVFKATLKLLQDKYSSPLASGNVTILPIGKKASEYFSKRNISVINDYWNIFHAISFQKARVISEYIMKSFLAGKFDKVELVYNEFKNVATQVLITEQFLPLVPPGAMNNEVDYIYQPDQAEIVFGIIPKALNTQLYKAILDSDAAFNGAQMTAMDKATENAGDLLKDLKLTYNRTRQAAITKEILEIVAGAEALKSA
jgi:F-type H+-transporting ATPase subunit gamma